MTAEKMLSLFSWEEGLAMLWRLPSLGRERRFRQAASRNLGASPGRSASLAGAEAGSQSGAPLAEAEPLLEGKPIPSEGANGKLPEISLAEGEAVRRALKQAAELAQAGRLLGSAALEGVASPGRRLFPAGTLAGSIAREIFVPRAAGATLVWQREAPSADGGAGGFSGPFPGTLASSGKAGGGSRAEGQRLRQAAFGREMLLARSMRFLREQESGAGDFDGLLSRLERQLAIELGAG